MYIIVSSSGYWNNEVGWIEWPEFATAFTTDERDRLRLPIGTNVRWERSEYTWVG